MASRSPRAASSSKPASRSRGSRSRSSRQVSCDWVRRFREPIAALFLYASPLSLSPRSGFFMKRNKVQDLRVSDFMSTDLVTASPDETLGDVLGKMKSLVGIISRSDIVRALVETRALEGVVVRDFMTPNPQAVAEDDTVEHAVQIIRSLGERSVPVVDKHRHLKGVVGLKDVVDLFARPKVREQYGDRAGREEKGVIEVKSVMRYPPFTVGPEADVQRAAELMAKHHVSSIIVTEKDEPVGIITSQDLMQFLAGLRDREQLFVEIGGLEDEPKDTYDDIYAVIQKEMRRIAPLVTPRTLTIHFQKYKPEGDRWKYSLRARFTTAHRIYYAHEFDWDLPVTLTKLLDTLYKRIVKEKERKVTERKRHHQST